MPQRQEFQIEGRQPVLAALRAGRPLDRIVLAEGIKPSFREEIEHLAGQRGIQVVTAPRTRLEAMATSKEHQGVVALAASQPYLELEELLTQIASRGNERLLVVLDQVQDPRNLGAIARTAEAAGAQGLVTTIRHSAPLSPVALKAAAGALEYLPVAGVTNLVRALATIKQAGLWVVGADAGARAGIWETDLKGPLALLVGSEGRGLRRLSREAVDLLVRIPIEGRTSSLNASIAAAVILYEIKRQRYSAASLP